MHGLRVLLIEDDAADAEVIRLALGGSPYVGKVVTLNRLPSAAVLASADIIVLDLELPGYPRGSGEVVREARRRVPDATLIVCTGQSDETLLAECMADGVPTCVKSDDAAELVALIERAVCEAAKQPNAPTATLEARAAAVLRSRRAKSPKTWRGHVRKIAKRELDNR